VFLVLYGWVSLNYILPEAHADALGYRMMRLFAPFAFFVTSPDDGHPFVTWRGAPWYFVGWQLCLCAIAVLVATLRGANGASRRHITGGLAVSSALALVMYGLAVAL
jgi:hypothetical protein